MHEIGTMHYLGDGVEPDSDEAVRWFRRAAELGVSNVELVTPLALHLLHRACVSTKYALLT